MCPRAPEPIISNFGYATTTLIHSRKNQIIFRKYYSRKSRNIGNQKMKIVEKVVPENPKDPSDIFEDFEYGIDIFEKT